MLTKFSGDNREDDIVSCDNFPPLPIIQNSSKEQNGFSL